MWPWGHAAVAYLAFLGYGVARRKHLDDLHLLPAVVAVCAAQLPDVIDKPLAWWFHLVPSGRSLGHSMFSLIALTICCWLVTRRIARSDLIEPFVIGYLTHLFADGYGALLAGRWDRVSYFFYPLTPAPTYENEGGFVSHVVNLHLSSGMKLQIALAAVATTLVVGIEVGRRVQR